LFDGNEQTVLHTPDSGGYLRPVSIVVSHCISDSTSNEPRSISVEHSDERARTLVSFRLED
jgi:hypothetical protein